MSLKMFTVYCWITIYSILSVVVAFKIVKYMTDRLGNLVACKNPYVKEFSDD